VTNTTRQQTPVWESEEAPPVKRRSFFWPAFVVAFLAWSLASCGGIAAMIGLDDLSLADFQSSGPVWTPPAPLPTETTAVAEQPAEEPAAPTEETRFQPGGRAQNITNSRVNIRRSPGYLGQAADNVLAQMEPGETVEIAGWPRNADNLIWWPSRYQSADGAIIEGWVAESTASGVQILAPVP
jgi:hypothetical protein